MEAVYGDLEYVRESNRSLGSIARKSWEDFLALRRNGRGGPARLGAVGALVWKNLSKVPQFFVREKRLA